MASRSQVALVIPAWHEQEAIGPVLREVPRLVVDAVYVVVGSTDDPTGPVARAHGARVVVPERRGYGAACWAGAQAVRASGALIIAFLDGDYADPPADLPRLLRPLLDGRADLALGCRNLADAPLAQPLHAQLGNALVLTVIRLLSHGRDRAQRTVLHDLPSFKAIRADCLERLEMQEMTYGWTVEMLVKALQADLRIAHVAVRYRPRLAGHSKVSGTVRGTLGAAWKLVTCSLRYTRWQPAPRSARGPAEVPA